MKDGDDCINKIFNDEACVGAHEDRVRTVEDGRQENIVLLGKSTRTSIQGRWARSSLPVASYIYIITVCACVCYSTDDGHMQYGGRNIWIKFSFLWLVKSQIALRSCMVNYPFYYGILICMYWVISLYYGIDTPFGFMDTPTC